ncbi:MAG: HAD-IB family phosphatase [Haloarculaceae archaeon]
MTPPLPADLSVEPNTGPGPALVTFDFDGTLAEQRGGWGLLYRLFGVEEAGDERTAAFWDGEISYEEWLQGNVADWREHNVRREHVERATDAVKLIDGAHELLESLQRSPVPFGVISAGVTDLTRKVEPYDPAFLVSNDVVWEDGVPVDAVPRVPPDSKGDILAHLCDVADIDPEDVVHVGDSHSDVEAFELVGTAVLFNRDDRVGEDVTALADHVVDRRDLTALEPLVVPDE